MDYTAGTRKRAVENVAIIQLTRGDPLFPSGAFPPEQTPDNAVMVCISIREGLSRARRVTRVFASEVEASEFAELVRSQSGEAFTADQQLGLRECIEDLIDDGGLFLQLGDIGDEESPLAFDILEASGLRSIGGGASSKVCEYLGPARVAALQSKHGDNWCSAAVFEYCWLVLPHSSAAFSAAAFQFHYYITGDDLSAGFYWRDMEFAASGAEAAAANTIEMRKRAGQAGRERSARARIERRAKLMAAIEAVAQRNPDLPKLGPEITTKLALAACVEAEPRLWSQGSQQVDEYLGEIRRGEAGLDMQTRLLAIFPTKPLKRQLGQR